MRCRVILRTQKTTTDQTESEDHPHSYLWLLRFGAP